MITKETRTNDGVIGGVTKGGPESRKRYEDEKG